MDTQLLVLITGHNATGKTTLSKQIVSKLDINRVSGDLIRDMLISSIKFYSGVTYSYPNKKIKSVNRLVSTFRRRIIRELLSQNQSIVVDGAGITRKERKKYLDLKDPFKQKILTIIIEAVLDEKELLSRLKDRDDRNKQNKWVDFYRNIRKEKYEPVGKAEADFILKYDQNNSAEIIKSIKNIQAERCDN